MWHTIKKVIHINRDLNVVSGSVDSSVIVNEFTKNLMNSKIPPPIPSEQYADVQVARITLLLIGVRNFLIAPPFRGVG